MTCNELYNAILKAEAPCALFDYETCVHTHRFSPSLDAVPDYDTHYVRSFLTFLSYISKMLYIRYLRITLINYLSTPFHFHIHN